MSPAEIIAGLSLLQLVMDQILSAREKAIARGEWTEADEAAFNAKRAQQALAPHRRIEPDPQPHTDNAR